MKHGHTKLMVCSTQMGHQRALDTNTTRVWHAVLCVLFKKYYFSTRTRLEYVSDTTGHSSNTARTQPSTFFPIIWWTKRIQRPKNPSSFKNFIWGVNRNNTSYFLEEVYEVYMTYIKNTPFFWEGFKK